MRMTHDVTKPVQLRKDSRGRVRFGHNGRRFEVTANGISCYNRYRAEKFRSYGLPGKVVEREDATYIIPVDLLNDADFVHKLTAARDLFRNFKRD